MTTLATGEAMLHIVSRTLRVAALTLLVALLAAAPAIAAPSRLAEHLGSGGRVSGITRAVTAPAVVGQTGPMAGRSGITAVGTSTAAAEATPSAPTPPELNPLPSVGGLNSKVVIGVVAVLLFIIVFYGRKIRKARKKNGGGGA